MGLALGFWLLAAATVASALAVVTLRDIFRAAIFLVLCFVGVAGVYILLSADFLAAVQILIYAGAIAVLIIFAIMLTRDPQQGNPPNRLRYSALLIAGLVLATLILVILNTPWSAQSQLTPEPTTAALASALFDKDKGFILPFEIASVLLLAAMIGAIVLAREDKG